MFCHASIKYNKNMFFLVEEQLLQCQRINSVVGFRNSIFLMHVIEDLSEGDDAAATCKELGGKLPKFYETEEKESFENIFKRIFTDTSKLKRKS